MAGQGIEGLIEMLADQQMLRGTGAVEVSGTGRLYLVFGHPVHAETANDVGLAAVDVMAAAARAEPLCGVTWSPGITAGQRHSLGPTEGVLARLRGRDAPDPIWGIVITSICASLEAVLHRHAAVYVEILRGARPEPAAILAAIREARSTRARMVSVDRVSSLLDEAEALVREKMVA